MGPLDRSTSHHTLVCNSIRAKLRGSLHLEKSKPHRVAPPNENKKQTKQTSVWIVHSLPFFSGMETETLPSECVCFHFVLLKNPSGMEGKQKKTHQQDLKMCSLNPCPPSIGVFLLGTSVKPRGWPLRPQTKLRAHGQCSDKCMPERIQLEAN